MARCVQMARGSAARSNKRRKRAMIAGSADSRENWIATRSALPEAGSTATTPRTPPISIVRAYRSLETTSTPGMARAFRKEAIAGQSYGGR